MFPPEWLIGRICDEFPSLSPSQALHEPLDLCLRIVEYRAYDRAKELVEKTEKLDDLPDTPMVKLVQEIQHDIALEAWRAKQSGH